MILLIDWGNSFLKFVLTQAPFAEVCELGFWQNSQTIEVGRVETIEQLKAELPDSINLVLVSSVRSEADNQALKSLIEGISKNIFFAKTSRQACGVSCAYDKPEQLGIDRWLNTLAASSYANSVGVISLGTAITLDIVKDKQHLGGHILPNKLLMLKSLGMTAQVKAKFKPISKASRLLGQSTSDCVNRAIEQAINAYISHTMSQLEKEYAINQWIITGGGANLDVLIEQNQTNIVHHSRLIFEGLTLIYNDSLG
jgi:type III pantothenate kinase